MPLPSSHTIVVLPNETKVEVTFFCSNNRLPEKEKDKSTQLVVQLHDCHCYYTIDKKRENDFSYLETLVQKTVINAKGHLC